MSFKMWVWKKEHSQVAVHEDKQAKLPSSLLISLFFLPFSAAPTLKNQTETAVHFARLPSTDGRRRTLTDAFSPGASICCCSEVWKESCKRKGRSDKNHFISYDGFDCENAQVTMRRLRLNPHRKSQIQHFILENFKAQIKCVCMCIYMYICMAAFLLKLFLTLPLVETCRNKPECGLKNRDSRKRAARFRTGSLYRC